MNELPSELLVNILSRLKDSEALARCRVVSKTWNSLSREVRAVNFICTLSRYSKSRSRVATPYKTILKSLIADSCNFTSISIGVDRALSGMSFDDLDEEESDDLYLTKIVFVEEWLPRVCGYLEMLSISDFWLQSCWRKSGILALISSNCSRLLKLELKNAWLSVDGLTKMPNLRHLTLEFIRLDDENLEKINDCFSYLQTLNLIGVGGLKEPRIHLLHLKTCHWTVSNAPISLAIIAPNLLELKLKCNKPNSLILKTPKLLKFHLSVEDSDGVCFSEFQDLNTLDLISPNIYKLIKNTNFGNKITTLVLDSVKSETLKLNLGTVLEAFPDIISLTLSSEIWSNFETHFESEDLVHMKGRLDTLKHITARVLIPGTDVNQTVLFIRFILDNCRGLSDVRLMIHKNTDLSLRSYLISTCMMNHPRVRWIWGMWSEGGEDVWISSGV